MNTDSTIRKEVAFWTRWLHIYLSMFSFATLFFFAVTGITLNHPASIDGQQITQKMTGTVPSEIMKDLDSVPARQVELVEYFRSTFSIKARLNDLRVDKSECTVSFKAPGYAADAFIEKENGTFELSVTHSGVIAIMNDLHKGRDTGSVWPLVIDLSAILMIVVSITGFVMIFFLRKKRLNGLLLFLLGSAVLVILYYAFAR